MAIDYIRDQAARLRLPESPVEEEIAFAGPSRVDAEEPRATKGGEEVRCCLLHLRHRVVASSLAT